MGNEGIGGGKDNVVSFDLYKREFFKKKRHDKLGGEAESHDGDVSNNIYFSGEDPEPELSVHIDSLCTQYNRIKASIIFSEEIEKQVGVSDITSASFDALVQKSFSRNIANGVEAVCAECNKIVLKQKNGSQLTDMEKAVFPKLLVWLREELEKKEGEIITATVDACQEYYTKIDGRVNENTDGNKVLKNGLKQLSTADLAKRCLQTALTEESISIIEPIPSFYISYTLLLERMKKDGR